jgi:hypothetical protein
VQKNLTFKKLGKLINSMSYMLKQVMGSALKPVVFGKVHINNII